MIHSSKLKSNISGLVANRKRNISDLIVIYVIITLSV